MLDSVLSSISTRGRCVRLGFIFYPLPEGHVLDSVLSSISTRGTCVRLGFIFYLYQREMC